MPKMTKLSVNVNKLATLRNARGGNTPGLVCFVEDCEKKYESIAFHPSACGWFCWSCLWAVVG